MAGLPTHEEGTQMELAIEFQQSVQHLQDVSVYCSEHTRWFGQSLGLRIVDATNRTIIERICRIAIEGYQDFRRYKMRSDRFAWF